MKNNYHTHSIYCDGKDTLEKTVRQAVALGYAQLGFSSHAPLPFENNFAICEDKLPEYVAEVRSLQSQYTDLQLFCGLECDFIPEMTKPFSYFQKTYNLDYVIGGLHLVRPENSSEIWFIDGPKREIYDDGLANLFGGDVKKAVTRFWEQSFEMIETQQFDILAHFDKIKMHNQNRYFTEDEPWYRQLADHCVELIHQRHMIVEINTRGIYKGRCPDYYPSDYLLAKLAKSHTPMVVSSDAHKAEELALGCEDAISHLREFGIKSLMYRNKQQWEEYAI